MSTHGTRTMYNRHGCRCETCNAWNRARRATQAARRGHWQTTDWTPKNKVTARIRKAIAENPHLVGYGDNIKLAALTGTTPNQVAHVRWYDRKKAGLPSLYTSNYAAARRRIRKAIAENPHLVGFRSNTKIAEIADATPEQVAKVRYYDRKKAGLPILFDHSDTARIRIAIAENPHLVGHGSGTKIAALTGTTPKQVAKVRYRDRKKTQGQA